MSWCKNVITQYAQNRTPKTLPNLQATNEKTHLQFPLPKSLRKHHEYLSSIATSIPPSFNIEESIRKDFLVPIYCNTFTPKQEVFVQVIERTCSYNLYTF